MQRRRRDLPGDAADAAENGGLIMMHAENGMADRRAGPADLAARQDRSREPRPHAPARVRGRGDEPRHPPGRARRSARSTSSTSRRRDALERGPGGARRGARRRSPRPARSTCSSRSTTWRGTASRARSSCARRRSATADHQDELWKGLGQDDLQVVVDGPLPVRLPRARRTSAQGDFRRSRTGCPASRTGSTCSTRRRRRRADRR